ncbi:MAG: hypothetical protein LGB78_04905 [Sulfurovum sp.]|nr:hypothetical protein [Sulfurovum sp.]
MQKGQFKGYILEEVLAYLIRTSGYKLITKPPLNDPDITERKNGLNLRGRGADHQIDVLGELNWIPVFDFPLRLLVEAKFRNEKTGIDVIRSEVGILADVNQNYIVHARRDKVKPRYRYASTVFSTSGFSTPAVDMAVAHQIQLADLSLKEYDGLKRKINNFTDLIYEENGYSGAEGSEINLDSQIVKKIRTYLRSTLNNIYPHPDGAISKKVMKTVDNLITFVKDDYKELFIGMSQGGFMLLLKAENPDVFVKYAKENPTHNIKIHWRTVGGGKEWEITPMDDTSYKLIFKLPDKLHNLIYKIAEDKFESAINEKERHFSKISITYHDERDDRDYIFNLKFKRENLEREEDK